MESRTGGAERAASKGWIVRVSIGAAAVITGALIGVAFLLSSAYAQERQDQKIVYYEGDPEFCPRLLRDLDQVKFVEPVLPAPPPGKLIEFSFYGAVHAYDYQNLYFVGKNLPDGLLDWIERDNNPPNSGSIEEWDTFERDRAAAVRRYGIAGYVIDDSRWRALDDQCPGFLKLGSKGSVLHLAPGDFALFQIDIDGDRKTEAILYSDYGVGARFEEFDPTICQKRTIFADRWGSLRPIEINGQVLVFRQHHDGEIEIHGLHEAQSGVALPEISCVFRGLRNFNEYQDHDYQLRRKEK